jgi:hypothetical protein
MNNLLEKYLVSEKVKDNSVVIDYNKTLNELEIAFKKLVMNKDKMLKQHQSLIKSGRLHYGHQGDLGRLKSDINDILEYLK